MIKIRMCICCRQRFLQDSLLRLQIKDGALCLYTMSGRSFYICKDCVTQVKVVSIICRIFKIKNNENLVNFFKEISHKWQKNNYQKLKYQKSQEI